MDKTDLHPGLNALVHLRADGTLRAAVLNSTDHDVPVRRGTRYGHLEAAEAAVNGLGQSESQAQRMAKDAKAAAKTAKASQVPLPRGAAQCSTAERRDWLEAQYHLSNSPFLRNPVDLKAAEDVLLEFWDSFSHDGSYGKTHLLKHRIITEDVPPIKCRYRPINPCLLYTSPSPRDRG